MISHNSHYAWQDTFETCRARYAASAFIAAFDYYSAVIAIAATYTFYVENFSFRIIIDMYYAAR